jgi:hypothetical protein
MRCAEGLDAALEEQGARLDTKAFLVGCGCQPRRVAAVATP